MKGKRAAAEAADHVAVEAAAAASPLLDSTRRRE
jgi:hypothetical protein